MKNYSNLIIYTVLIYTLWLIGLTWGLLNLDYKISQPNIELVDNDTLYIYIHDTIYIEKEEKK